LERTKAFVLLILGLFVGFALSEILLRIHNPIPTRIKGEGIVLPINEKSIISNQRLPKLESTIVHTKNEIGFRGESPPDDLSKITSVITVGGSTTESFYLSDGKTWTDLLGKALSVEFDDCWINNAGLDGHSTFGHQILLANHIVKLKPKAVIFLVGINDIERSDLLGIPPYDMRIAGSQYSDFKDWLKKNSEVINLVRNLNRVLRARKRGIGDYKKDWDLEKFEETGIEKGKAILKSEHEQYLSQYKERVRALVRMCRQHGIAPIIFTQPLLWGSGKDPVTGINLENREVREGISSKMSWEILELYNEEVREVCEEDAVFCVDLAALLPKNSEYYYDECHFTNQGAAKVAEVTFRQVADYLKSLE